MNEIWTDSKDWLFKRMSLDTKVNCAYLMFTVEHLGLCAFSIDTKRKSHNNVKQVH